MPRTKEHKDKKLPLEASSVIGLLTCLFTNSGQLNYFEDKAILPVPSLEFKFFEYFVQCYLRLCFKETFFSEDNYIAFNYFKAIGVIFLYNNKGDCAVMGTYLKEGTNFIDSTKILIKYPLPVERFY